MFFLIFTYLGNKQNVQERYVLLQEKLNLYFQNLFNRLKTIAAINFVIFGYLTVTFLFHLA